MLLSHYRPSYKEKCNTKWSNILRYEWTSPNCLSHVYCFKSLVLQVSRHLLCYAVSSQGYVSKHSSFLVMLLFLLSAESGPWFLLIEDLSCQSRYPYRKRSWYRKEARIVFFSKLDYDTYSDYTQFTKTKHQLCARHRFCPHIIDDILKKF